ncbi:Uncharacterized protein OS=Planctomyces maris DSM 8797 GN=PM8797T_05000 PE=4 SV=1 [Tuwongella immobilis]|uniref:DUF997 family protein n=2 Tax=Tuwongella immobilis TaxID=692036 RepID=A0A6C2YW97_9BACT|nr:Uncharacterized protein OS=Planctomyces maris DSM 8797 GN=PM8797T_05000 PE=4 SV=1 [Tuwongella immobilis]VTS08222.1 Uncharacterized protein OS=Planctomyces maris DSM 8797 GN=PM8797T_05000 PE=4 SV=1 [Tuwongella immobilis]
MSSDGKIPVLPPGKTLPAPMLEAFRMPPPLVAQTTYRNARREAWFVALIWFLSLTWVVGYCYLRGYQHDADSWLVRMGLAVPRTAENFTAYFGFPDWILFGVFLPWIICSLITLWFGMSYMKEDDLGNDPDSDSTQGGHHA